MSNQDGPDEIHRMRSDGSAQKRLTDNGAPRDAAPVFSPGGHRVAFQSNADGDFEIFAMRADGEKKISLTDNPAGDFVPDWQPLDRPY